MSSVRRRPRENEDGVIAVVFALLAVVLFLVAALVVDLGLGRDTKRQAQNAADAAALAAANALYGNNTTPDFTAAVTAAKLYAASNFKVTDADWASCTDDAALRYRPAGTPACISFESSTSLLPTSLDSTKPDRVRVRVPTRDVPTSLGQLAGLAKMSVSTQAHAAINVATRAPCAICILEDRRPTAHNVQNGDITTSGGNIHFNGDVSVSSGGALRAESARAVTIQGQLINGGGTVTGTLLQNQPKLSDPLLHMPLPDPLSVPNKSLANDPCSPTAGGPGRYGTVAFSGAGCTLSPGLYVIAGSGSSWSANGSMTISGTGVTLYFTCGTPAVPALCAPPNAAGPTLDASGMATWTLKAPSSGPQKGQLLVYDRESVSEMRLKGNSGANLSGTVYAAKGTLVFNGASCVSAIDSLIVAGSIRFMGNPACLTSTYNDASNAPLPPADMRLDR